MLCACSQLLCVHSSCHNNENNMSDNNTRCSTLKVHMWDIIFAREENLQSFKKSGVPMAKHLDRRHFRAFKSSFKSLNYKQKVRKSVFTKWLPAKVCLTFFKNTIQLQLSTKYTAKINFVSSGTGLMWQYLKYHKHDCQYFILKLASFCF